MLHGSYSASTLLRGSAPLIGASVLSASWGLHLCLSLIITNPVLKFRTMAEHHFRRAIQPDYDCCVQERLALLYPVRRNRNHIDTTYRLVCVDLAQRGKQPLATSDTQRCARSPSYRQRGRNRSISCLSFRAFGPRKLPPSCDELTKIALKCETEWISAPSSATGWWAWASAIFNTHNRRSQNRLF